MRMQGQIEAKLRQAFNPEILEVINESHLHNVPPGSESHFKVVIVSEQFIDKRLVARHRLVNQALANELAAIHALALHTLTPDEYFKRAGAIADSPLCMGGSKAS
ncbi:BolA/IbaG family iron-sulfur metabolism protein [uncultured Thiothrix sp.]|uniref:BolA family protein n=1 Tax=uncultured Thiothrix sp. TaxID=223185 RepID=UPI0026050B20|nr:BolA/IbaG family iron-sulfur metabolism protein [uncultured Thiothrix sp.]HMT92761.1 BolA/IbaG family iron-sulfur metabolism protein [Thiolinea sp.]